MVKCKIYSPNFIIFFKKWQFGLPQLPQAVIDQYWDRSSFIGKELPELMRKFTL